MSSLFSLWHYDDSLIILLWKLVVQKIQNSMQRKSKLLPMLAGGKSKSRLTKDKLKIEDLLKNNSRNTHKDYRNDEQFTNIKANNFLSRMDTLDNPQLIFAISDQIKQAMHSKDALHHSKDKENMAESEGNGKALLWSFRQGNPFQTTKTTFHRGESKVMAQEREEALELARWLDDKLGKLRTKPTVTFLDILEYKQTILNFALGKIIDSLTRRCKEQGQILSLIWDSTFKMFEAVFNLLVEANRSRERENSSEARELHQMFEVNHNFLREENAALKKENGEIFEQMKRVIIWNKRLRKERKALHTANRILQYRNATYSQALEETLEMVLQTTPDPAVLQTAKKVVLKLGKEKNRKKRCFKQEVDNELSCAARDIVYNWLKKNSCLDEEKLQLFKESCFSKQDGFLFSELDDINEMKRIDIYDFFKLYDVAVQAVPATASDFAQCDKKAFRHAEVMTKNISTIEHGCQTVHNRRNSQASVDSPTAKKRVEINTANKQASISKYKKEKSKTPLKGQPKDPAGLAQLQALRERSQKEGRLNNSSNMEDRQARMNIHRDLRKRSVNDFYFQEKLEGSFLPDDRREDKVSETKIIVPTTSALKIQEDRAESDHGDNTSISELLEDDNRTRGLVTTKNIITNNSQIGREKSLADFNEGNLNGSARMIQMPFSKRREQQKRSMAYIRADTSKPLGKLHNSRDFNDIYKQQREVLENNKQEFVDQIIRRRSFFTRRKVEFNNYRQAEDVSEKFREYMRGTKYGSSRKPADKANLLSISVDRWTKRGPAPSNMAKSKALTSAKGLFESIMSSVEEVVRIPPKNKVFVNNSISTLSKYISQLVVDYVRQLKREKEEIPNQCEKALYPLSLLLMERMTCKYGLKDIAERKIKHFIEKVLTFATISEKISLYSLLLGLEDNDVGSDELLVYLKCIVYFQEKKPGRDGSTESSLANIELVRQHLRKLLQYFFDGEYLNLVELKLQIYFQQNPSYATVEGIALIVIRQLLRRKKELRLRYSRVHAVCAKGDNFFSNVFHLLRIATNYRDLAAGCWVRREAGREREAIDALKEMRSRGTKRHDKSDRKILASTYDICKISEALRELLKRSDIMDEEYGKSITEERFITAAMLLNLPNGQDLEAILDFMRKQFLTLQTHTPYLAALTCEDFKSLDKLARVWNKSTVQGEGEPAWAFAKVYAEKVEEEVLGVMGRLGSIGTAIESYLFNQEPAVDR